ncbi:MAG: DUF3501 family protein [Alphaproteobacteria bacterium]|nr:DUF3501 family protein [Alphaproteobacteria bacterium]
MTRREITRSDILPTAEYASRRAELRRGVVALKKLRRIDVGPFATFYFENRATMWHQIHEMLYIEKGGEAQIADELAAYNPLVPDGSELVSTVMFEIDDPVRRARVLARLGGVENHAFLSFAGEKIKGRAETDTERTSEEGKASSVQFIHFPFTPTQIAAFRQPATQIIIGFDHPEYGHMAVMPEAVRGALSEDFDAG